MSAIDADSMDEKDGSSEATAFFLKVCKQSILQVSDFEG